MGLSGSSSEAFAIATEIRRPSVVIAVGVIMLSTLVTVPSYPGSIGTYLLFGLASALLVASALVRPMAYGHASLVLFLTLGFWLKVVTAMLDMPVLIEPTGDFAHRPDQWDRSLQLASAGLLGASGARFAWLRLTGGAHATRALARPSWYDRWRIPLWAATALLVIVTNLANWKYVFYAVGVHPRLVLPAHLNVAVAWWLTVGAGLWLAMLLQAEFLRRPGSRWVWWLGVPMAEALVSTCVMLSRGFYVMKILPYALVLLRSSSRAALRVGLVACLVWGLVAAVGFGASLVGVSWLRLTTYPEVILPSTTRQPSTPAQGAPSAESGTGATSVPTPGDPPPVKQPSQAHVNAVVYQLSRMVVGRWIGLEGVMAAASAPGTGLAMLETALTEDPNIGNDALFQRLSKAPYEALEHFTFMTLPGLMAVLGLSGSVFLTGAGMAVIAFLVLATEGALSRWLDSDLVRAVAGVAMANALVQMNFPYLTLVFFIEMWTTLALLAAIWTFGPRLVQPASPILATVPADVTPLDGPELRQS